MRQYISSLDPNQVLQQVWKGDYPASWRVFNGEETSTVGACLVILLVMIAVPLLCITAQFIIVAILEATSQGGFPNDDYFMMFFGIIILVTLSALSIFCFRAIKRYRSKRPKPMIVIMPDGVVGYRRKKVWAIAFANVAHIQVGASTQRGANTGYTPALWLDLLYRGGQRGECAIEIAPQEMIAQSILDAHTAFLLQHPS